MALQWDFYFNIVKLTTIIITSNYVIFKYINVTIITKYIIRS